MKQSHDKQLTRACAERDVWYLAYGRWWLLEQGCAYRVEFNRDAPGASKVKQVKLVKA